MPASIETTPAGYAIFTCVKLVGYSLFALKLNRSYRLEKNVLAVGTVRTLMGMILGGGYFLLWGLVFGKASKELPYWMGLVPLRIFEWWLLIRIFYDRPFRHPASRGNVAEGIGWSYLLDLPAMFGFLICGISIC